MRLDVPARKILIVEDEQIVAMDVRGQLQILGYEVAGTASSGKEALSLVEATSPDLVLMDIQLQGALDGIATAGEIRRQWQIPVVFMTAFAGVEFLARARVTGPYGYLTKPFRANDLNATVTVALEQHQTIRDIFQEHGWLRTVLESMSDGVIATDLYGSVKFLNPMAESLTGWTMSEALGRPIEEVYPARAESGESLAECQLRRVISANAAVGRHRFLLAARDKNVVVEDSAAPIHDAQDRLAGAVMVIADVTERRRMEQERERLQADLERSNRELSRFSHALSHDLQAPARSIRVLGELLRKGKKGNLNEYQAELIGMMTDAAAGMQRLIASMLDFALVSQGELKFRPVPVSEAIEAARVRLAGAIADSGASITYGILPVVDADRIQFEQVFQNLLANAIQYGKAEEHPEISISAESVGQEWIFSVQDNGVGIPPEHLQSIFEPLKRLHGRDVPGSGLGLALCRIVIERHGGRIWAESAGPGQGATIRFTLQPSSTSSIGATNQ